MRAAISSALLIVVLFIGCAGSKAIRVACVGDSITYGGGIEGRETNAYPAQLGRLLGDRYEVRNFGVGGATLLKKGSQPYWDLPAFTTAQRFKPDIVIIQLGTNDSTPENWAHKKTFAADYQEFVETFAGLEGRPAVWLCYPVPAFRERWGISDRVITNEIIPLIDAVAQQTQAPAIDLHSALSGHADLFPDGIHPNAEGAYLMAESIYQALRR